jgi:hypothetical protein
MYNTLTQHMHYSAYLSHKNTAAAKAYHQTCGLQTDKQCVEIYYKVHLGGKVVCDIAKALDCANWIRSYVTDNKR